MSTRPNADDEDFLLRARECKFKAKIDLKEFFALVAAQPHFSRINQRGIYILYLAQLLLAAYLSYRGKVNTFVKELEQRDKKVRRPGGGGGNARPRQKKRGGDRRRNPLDENRNIEDLSDESLENPSNIDRTRINQSDGKQDDGSNPASSREPKEESQDSKDSRRNDLKLELNKITEQIRGHEETYISDPLQDIQGITFDDNSQSTSSQDLISGEIRDFNEKLKILSATRENQSNTRRKTRPTNTTSTKTKKKRAFVMDQSTMLEETTETRIDITLNDTNVSLFDHLEGYELQDEFFKDLKEFDAFNEMKAAHLFSEGNMLVMKEFMSTVRDKPEELGMRQREEYIQMQDNDIPSPDYTMSQPMSVPVFSQDFMNDSGILKDGQCSFNDILVQTGKEKSMLFYQMLWKEQNGDILIKQESPESFGPITIRQL